MSESEGDIEVLAVSDGTKDRLTNEDGTKDRLTDEEFTQLKSTYEYLAEFFTLKSATKGDKDGLFHLTFCCTKCSKNRKSSTKSPTSNLHSHIKFCHNGLLKTFEKVIYL